VGAPDASIEVAGEAVDLLSLEDLVTAKKTQSDKDWPMIRRLVEQSYFSPNAQPDPPVEFWLREVRTPELLIAVAARHPQTARRMADARRAVCEAIAGEADNLSRALAEEEQEERREKTVATGSRCVANWSISGGFAAPAYHTGFVNAPLPATSQTANLAHLRFGV
jgi:hypothetical protein